MMPVSDHQTTRAVMPQGAVALQEASSQGAFSSGGTAGFVVEGPEMDLTQQELDNLETEHKDIAYDEILECVREGKSLEKCEENKAKTFFQYTKVSDFAQWLAFTWESGNPFSSRYGETFEYVVFENLFDFGDMFSDFESKIRGSVGMILQNSILLASATGIVTMANWLSRTKVIFSESNTNSALTTRSAAFWPGQQYYGYVYELHFFRFQLPGLVDDQVLAWFPNELTRKKVALCVLMWFIILIHEFGLLLSGSYLAAIPLSIMEMCMSNEDEMQTFGWTMLDASIIRLLNARDELVEKITGINKHSCKQQALYWVHVMGAVVVRILCFVFGPAMFMISLIIMALFYLYRIIFLFGIYSNFGKAKGVILKRSSAFEVEAPRGARAHPSPPQYAEEDAVSETDSLTKTTATTKFSF